METLFEIKIQVGLCENQTYYKKMVSLSWVGIEERGLDNCKFACIREVKCKKNCDVLQSWSEVDVLTLI